MTTQPLSLAVGHEPAPAIIRCLHGPQPERRARRVVTDVMTALGITTDLPDLELVVHELVANARQHAPGPYELRIFIGFTSVKIAVLDGGADHTRVARKLGQAAGGVLTDGESGRGLQIVTGLFRCWGAESAATCTGMTPAKQVWVAMPRPGRDVPGHVRDREAVTG
ncbi:MAG: ATP-binding protein [Streptosporangiaceae bacterium]